MDLKLLRKFADRNLAALHLARETHREAIKKKDEAEKRCLAAENAQQVIQGVAKGVQELVHAKLASVVSRCLKTVFVDQPYTFKVVFEMRRGKTEADLVLVRDGLELRNPVDEVGLGVVDVASFALRLVRLLLARPKRRRVLVVDEPFRFLHGTENRQRMATLLEVLSKEFKIQIVMTTGQDWLRIGKIIEL